MHCCHEVDQWPALVTRGATCWTHFRRELDSLNADDLQLFDFLVPWYKLERDSLKCLHSYWLKWFRLELLLMVID